MFQKVRQFKIKEYEDVIVKLRAQCDAIEVKLYKKKCELWTLERKMKELKVAIREFEQHKPSLLQRMFNEKMSVAYNDYHFQLLELDILSERVNQKANEVEEFERMALREMESVKLLILTAERQIDKIRQCEKAADSGTVNQSVTDQCHPCGTEKQSAERTM